MERVMHLERGGWGREDRRRTERLGHRRAAAERCVRGGLLRLCSASTGGAEARRGL